MRARDLPAAAILLLAVDWASRRPSVRPAFETLVRGQAEGRQAEPHRWSEPYCVVVRRSASYGCPCQSVEVRGPSIERDSSHLVAARRPPLRTPCIPRSTSSRSCRWMEDVCRTAFAFAKSNTDSEHTDPTPSDIRYRPRSWPCLFLASCHHVSRVKCTSNILDYEAAGVHALHLCTACNIRSDTF